MSYALVLDRLKQEYGTKIKKYGQKSEVIEALFISEDSFEILEKRLGKGNVEKIFNTKNELSGFSIKFNTYPFQLFIPQYNFLIIEKESEYKVFTDSDFFERYELLYDANYVENYNYTIDGELKIINKFFSLHPYALHLDREFKQDLQRKTIEELQKEGLFGDHVTFGLKYQQLYINYFYDQYFNNLKKNGGNNG